MTHEDRQLLFTALGFLAVTMQRNSGNDAARALAFAALIEEFCRANVPQAFDPPGAPQPSAANPS